MDSITYHVIQMSQCIKIFHCRHIFQRFPESHPVNFFIRFSFKDFTIIRILSANKMDGSNYKIKGICLCQPVIRFSQMLLKPNLHSDPQIQFVFILFLQTVKPAKILIQVKLKCICREIRGLRKVQIHMICDTDPFQPFFDCCIQHKSNRCFTVSRKARMHMAVTFYHNIVPPPSTYSPSYNTTACPGVAARIGSSNVQTISSSPVRSTVHHAPLWL